MPRSVGVKHGNGGRSTAPERELGVLLACFGEPNGAGKARGPVDGKLRADGDVILDNTIVKVDEKRKASIHDPHRVRMGTLIPGITWGLFGLVTGGWKSAAIWAPLGAICGGLYTYYKEHHATKAQLRHIGTSLPARSSVLLTFAETSDPRRTLHALADHAPTSASIAAIDADLSARVFAGALSPVEVGRSSGPGTPLPDETVLDSMVVIRYADVGGAKQVARDVKASKAADAAEVELVIETDKNGHRHVTDPTLGPAGFAYGDAVAWALFGVAVGAISGAFAGGNGIVTGIIKGGLFTGIGWGVFGLFAGAAYGLWAGRSISRGKLKRLGPLLAPGTSMVLAWTDGAASRETIDLLTKSRPQSDRLVLHFHPAGRGAVLAPP